jgi:hypothetical protein
MVFIKEESNMEDRINEFFGTDFDPGQPRSGQAATEDEDCHGAGVHCVPARADQSKDEKWRINHRRVKMPVRRLIEAQAVLLPPPV